MIATSRCKKALTIHGIYRYLDHKDNILYIGQGKIRQRFLESERKNWGIHRIEYSLIDHDENGEKAKEAERFWLDSYQEDYNTLPTFNRVSGMKKSI